MKHNESQKKNMQKHVLQAPCGWQDPHMKVQKLNQAWIRKVKAILRCCFGNHKLILNTEEEKSSLRVLKELEVFSLFLGGASGCWLSLQPQN